MVRLATIGCAAALIGAAAAPAGAAPVQSASCEGASVVCFGTLPPVRTRVTLVSEHGSHEHGTAWITFGFHNTAVVVVFQGAPKRAVRTLSLRLGGCSSRKVVYYLGKVARGRRFLQADPVSRLSGFSLVVRAGRSTAGGPIVACGVIPFER